MKRGARAEAKAAGLLRYFTGQPCKNGHIAERWVNGCACVICKAETVKAYYREHPDQWRQRAKDWREKNPERVRASNATFRAANPEYGKRWNRWNVHRITVTARAERLAVYLEVWKSGRPKPVSAEA